MAYADFTLDSVMETFGLSIDQVPLFASPLRVKPSAWLVDALAKGRSIAFFSEKSRSEFMVAPVLLTCQENLKEQCCVYSGVRLDIDPERGLKGECDYLLARTPPSPALRSPLLVVVEAKKNDIEEGLAQCIAQMIGARIFNERHKEIDGTLFGCVTTGEVWQFLRLVGNQLTVDSNRYYLADVDVLLGILTSIMNKLAR